MSNNLNLKDWLMLPCLQEEVLGDNQNGYYLGIIKIREKINFMRSEFSAIVHFTSFQHFLFTRQDKEIFSSGSIEVEIIQRGHDRPSSPYAQFHQKLIGAYSFNISDYDNEFDKNEQYAGTTKSLCIGNALGNEYPQFGSWLNQRELVKKVRGKRTPSTSPAIKDSLKNL